MKDILLKCYRSRAESDTLRFKMKDYIRRNETDVPAI